MTAPEGVAPHEVIRLTAGRRRDARPRPALPSEEVVLRCAAWPEVVTRSAASRSAAPRRSGWRGRWAWRSPPSTPPTTTGTRSTREVARAAAALRAARPTAVNLMWAVDAQTALAAAHPGPPEATAAALADAARRIHDDEVARCRAIGAHALALLGRGARIMTHCNAGALATGGYGTALGWRRRPRRRPDGAGGGAGDAAAAAGVAPDGVGAGAGGDRPHPHHRFDGGGDDGGRRGVARRGRGRTASPRTATSRTRSAPTASRCSPVSTASP